MKAGKLVSGLVALLIGSAGLSKAYDPQMYVCSDRAYGWPAAPAGNHGFVVDRGTNSFGNFNTAYDTHGDNHLNLAFRTFQTNTLMINYLDANSNKIPWTVQFNVYATNHPNLPESSLRYFNSAGNDFFQITYKPFPDTVVSNFRYNTNSDTSQKWVDTNHWDVIDFVSNQKITNNGSVIIITTFKAPKPLPAEISVLPDFYTQFKNSTNYPTPPANLRIVSGS